MGGSTPALAAILSITSLIGVLLEYSHFRKDPIVDRVRDVSLTAAVFFRGLDRGVPQAEIGSVRDHLRIVGTVSRASGGDRGASGAQSRHGALNAARFSKSPLH